MSIFGRITSLAREGLVSDTTSVSGQVTTLTREILVQPLGGIIGQFTALARELLVSAGLPPNPGLIPIFPLLPYGFPLKVTPNLKTTIGIVKSGREVRLNQQGLALWQTEILFEELRDQTQNQTAYVPLSGFTQYQQLLKLWLSTYGQTGLFLFDAPWDDSRTLQQIGTGDGNTYIFTAVRTWGQGTANLTEVVGAINQIFQIQVNGVTVSPSNYYFVGNKILFVGTDRVIRPPGNGLVITSTFSFYYLCRFLSDEQDFEEFDKNRWGVKSLKFQSVYWP